MSASTVSTAAASVVRLDDYRRADLVSRIELDRALSDLAQLRAEYLALVDAEGMAGQAARLDAMAIGAERYAAGLVDGYEQGCRRMDADWATLCGRTFHANAPTLAELHERRAVPAGRVRDHDRTGDEIRADACASWLAAGLSLGGANPCQSATKSAVTSAGGA